tara:strand:+ start:298 stop:582 length:285 start_codon:yes stop_codon:yes gene_type:complete
MSRDYKIYHKYLARTSKVYNTSVSISEATGSGDFSKINSTAPVYPNYQIKEKPAEEIEVIFKKKYPLQYLSVRKKFEKKLKKLLKANEGDDPIS